MYNLQVFNGIYTAMKEFNSIGAYLKNTLTYP